MSNNLLDNDFSFYKVIGADGDLKKVYGIDRVVDSIINYLSIPKGNYPGDPEYGSELYKFVWEPTDELTKEGIYQEIKDVAQLFSHNVKISNFNLYYISNNKGFVVSFDIVYMGDKKEVTLEVTGDYVSRLG
jgi:phage baseplate assembly protein W